MWGHSLLYPCVLTQVFLLLQAANTNPQAPKLTDLPITQVCQNLYDVMAELTQRLSEGPLSDRYGRLVIADCERLVIPVQDQITQFVLALEEAKRTVQLSYSAMERDIKKEELMRWLSDLRFTPDNDQLTAWRSLMDQVPFSFRSFSKFSATDNTEILDYIDTPVVRLLMKRMLLAVGLPFYESA